MSLSELAVRPQSKVIPYGTRAEIPYGCGNVDAQAVVVGYDRAHRVPVYAVRVANNSEHALEARVVVRTGNASLLSLAPFSIVESLVPGAEDGANVRVTGKNLAFSLAVPRVRCGFARFPVVAAVVTFTATLLTLGSVVAASNLPAFTRSHPQPTPTPRVVVETKTITRHVMDAPLLDELDVPDAAVAGKRVRVRYGAHAPGDVYVVDEHGAVWARAALTPSGETALVVPAAAAGHVMRVVVVAQRGKTHAEMSARLAVVPDAEIVPAEPQHTPPVAAAALTVPSHVSAGAPFDVRLNGPHGEAFVSLNDASGAVIEQLDVRARDTHVTLEAPVVAAPAIVDVVVSITRGAGVEEIVRAVRVTPTSE